MSRTVTRPVTRPTSRLPRPLHPGAWWLWALGMATAASRTTNPLVLGLIIAVVAYVVMVRRSDAPWAGGFKAYVILGLVIIAIRVLFRMILDGQNGTTILFTLPEIPLPDAARGIRLGGPVSLEGILAAVYDGLRLATLLICVGAANVLADPKRLLKSMPAALHEISVAVVVALTVAPQLVASGQRIHRARKLRGETGKRFHLVRTVVIPVLTDALDRSLLLASAMDSRGYGRTAALPRSTRTATGILVLGGLAGTCIGVYGLLDSTTPYAIGVPMLAAGIAMAWAGFVVGGRRIVRTRYRPDPWLSAEWMVALCGIAAAAVIIGAGDVAALNPSPYALEWPQLPMSALVACAFGVLPGFLAPPVASTVAPPPHRSAPTPVGAAR